MTNRLFGKISGLAASELGALEKLYTRRPELDRAVTHEIAREMGEIAGRTGRMVGIIIDRRGRVKAVAVGDALEVEFPEEARTDTPRGGRLRGVRFICTKPENVKVGASDRLLLTKLRLDSIVFIGIDRVGTPHTIREGAVLPPGQGEPIEWREYSVSGIPNDYLERLEAREQELSKTAERFKKIDALDRVFLVAITTGAAAPARESMAELSELSRSCGMVVVDRMLQRRDRIDPATFVGSGFLEEVVHRANIMNAGRLVFDGELSPKQARNLERDSGLAVMDRTMLILEIFGRRAVTGDGKLRVDLAKLQYMAPHLAGQGVDLSRLGGGRGMRGSGEMKIETDRRVIRDNIVKLKKKINEIAARREEMRKRRRMSNIATVSLVGYTNAGKSTLFNSLTGAGVFAENLLFATLETTTRRARLPRGGECVFIDTVGFIKELPEMLLDAFRATIEEIDGSHLLLHIVDASNPAFPRQIETVNSTLRDLGFEWIPQMLVFNKRDLVDDASLRPIVNERGGILISALDAADVKALAVEVEARLSKPK
ncbi:MAG: GTPase HflX [Planctomycetes bacterium]|nr:GTPase HflX [Planctomycetota bacterium]